jgi:hypothetical protein
MVGRLGQVMEPILQHIRPMAGMARVMEKIGRVWLRPSSLAHETLRRATKQWLSEGWPVLNVTFHSSELMPGASPYVRNPQELKRFLFRLRTIFAEAMSIAGTVPSTLIDARKRLID